MEKTFGELSREEKLALLTAWVDGKQIQVMDRSKGLDKWLDRRGDAGVWYMHSIYRIAPVTPITFDWSHLNPKFKYIAKDKDGDVYAYSRLPDYDVDIGTWKPYASSYSVQALNNFTSLDAGTVEAKDSLIVRPE